VGSRADDDGEKSFVAAMPPYVLFVSIFSDDPDVAWWIGEDRDDGEDLVEVAEGEAPSLQSKLTPKPRCAR
jgi:hypothetical protein